ncbi:MAG: peptidase [Planctomycetia bacterium]|jgi:predicted esterase
MHKTTSTGRPVHFPHKLSLLCGAFFVILLIQATCLTPSLCATEFLFKDGRILRGSLAVTTGVEEPPKPLQQGHWQPILCVDDQLRRVFFSKRLLKPDGVLDDAEINPLEKFRIWQKPKREGGEVVWVGPISKTTKFDKFGRRTLTIRGLKGPVDVHQGITTLTPHWAQVEGISHVWDMRVSPASIPGDTLYEILKHQPHSSDIDHHKKIARFFIQMERYEDALKILEQLIADHPDIREDIERSITQLRRFSTQRLLRELKLRSDAGQHQLVWELLNKFDKEFPIESLPGDVVQEVREMIASNQKSFMLRKQLLEQYDLLVEKVSGEENQKTLKEIGKELKTELNQNTLQRLAAFRLAISDTEMAPSEKVALAATGWILGSNGAVADLTKAISVYQAREMIHQYLVEEDEKKRLKLLESFSSEQAATPKLVDQILKHMKPPVTSEPVEGKPGYFELVIEGHEKTTNIPKIPYVVQLPPEYDPHKTYPTILALHDAGSTPEDEIVWWAGPWNKKGMRHGQATRHGYIVIAPAWIPDDQKKYEYSAAAHAAVMWSLRDAMRRFSIDTDRVFLTGHAVGGEAAWDIGLAHPGLWAGVIPISMRGDRYIRHYWENAKLVPFYFLGGQLDGNWMDDNSQQFNRYIKRGYNSTIVEYRGRGHENFYEDILNLFDWMSHFKRDFYPREIKCVSMRPWDNYFWWVELDGMPEATMIRPDKWATQRNMVPMRTEARILPSNGIIVKTGADETTVWLSPQMIDFSLPCMITVNGKRLTRRNQTITPDVKVMLEDARTRCNRQQVFWAKVETE